MEVMDFDAGSKHCFPLKIEKELAERKLKPRGIKAIFNREEFCRLELSWIPSYCFKASSKDEKNEESYHFLFDGKATQLLAGGLKDLIQEPLKATEVPYFSLEEAYDAIRDWVVNPRNRFVFRGKVFTGLDFCSLVFRPYWVYYWKQGHHGYDFRILDAHSGERVGAQVKLVLIRYLLDQFPPS